MSDLKGVLLYTGDAIAAGANGATKSVKIPNVGPRHQLVQIDIEADAAVTSAVKVTIQGRLNSSATWMALDKQDDSTEASVTQASGAAVNVAFPVQLMPEMRAVISGTYAATTGNDIRVWLLADQGASRADS